MRRCNKVVIMVGLIVAVVAGAPTLAEPQRGQGNGNIPETGELYSNLWVVLRDPDGVPILDMYGCLQPVIPVLGLGLEEVQNPVNGEWVSLIKLSDPLVAECKVDPEYDALVQKVYFDRLNKGRAPESVLARALRDATGILGASVEPLQLDEASRFVSYILAEGTDIEATAIESPSANLAIRIGLMLEGYLVDHEGNYIVLPETPNPGVETRLDYAAAALGAAADTDSTISVDYLIYSDFIFGIAQSGTLPGHIEGVTFFDYRAYQYDRSAVFPGCVRGLLADFPAPGVFTPFEGTIMNCVFGSIDYHAEDDVGVCQPPAEGLVASNVHGIAHRADDSRAVIAFMRANAIAESTAVLDATVAGIDQVGQTEVCLQLGQ